MEGRFPRESGGYDHEASSGGGGAVYHHANGTMYFMGKLTITDNEAYVYVRVRDREVLIAGVDCLKHYETYCSRPFPLSISMMLDTRYNRSASFKIFNQNVSD